ncbi:glucose-1-phosphate adenylyltransferase [Cerasicoccus frondis]|uniref:glucose-1-phosphate adenylyltransferase n=1 Tax=Cerasicoccus frondis TaxID=490090 RepID=UPI002852C21D|nr:glucose-1-phosphate adenylyltransferase [Cerasicoccus frondis]
MEQNVISVIMGGGRGTRLYPLTKERCKPAVPLAGKYRLVDIPISNCLNSGINRIHLLSQFNTASLHNHIQSTYQFDPFGGGYVDIMSAEQTDSGETWYQGTADAVRQNLHHFNDGKNDLFLILSGDQLYRMDFRKIIDHHNKLGSDLTIAAKAMHKSEVAGLGVMRVGDDYSIQEFVEKPTDPAVIESLIIGDKLRSTLDGNPEDVVLASMGIYVFSARIMRDALNGDETDFGKEIIPGMLGKISMNSYIFDDYWEDIGTVAAFFEANLALTDNVPPFNFFDDKAPIYTRARYLPATKVNQAEVSRTLFGGGSIISQCKVHHCVIGVRSMIGDGTELTDVVMMGADWYETDEDRAENADLQRPNIGLGRNCKIKSAIIDKNARIGHDVELSPEGKPDGWSEGDLYVRDGVLMVMKNGVVASGTKVRP